MRSLSTSEALAPMQAMALDESLVGLKVVWKRKGYSFLPTLSCVLSFFFPSLVPSSVGAHAFDKPEDLHTPDPFPAPAQRAASSFKRFPFLAV